MACKGKEKKLIFEEKVDQLKKIYLEEGIPAVAEHLHETLSDWKKTQLRVAIAGRSGTGKSTFINSIRGITADDTDKDAAAVGVVETTKEVREYKYPDNDNFVLCDLPGLGTQLFRKETYLDDIKANEYDFFIIITKDRFYEVDLWLAKQVFILDKRFYLVRSNIGSDIKNDKVAHPTSHNEAEVIKKIRNDISGHLEKEFVEFEYFLIDSHRQDLYDFALLTKRLVEDLTSYKRDTLVFSLRCLSKEVIEEKTKRLAKRIPYVSFASAVIPKVINKNKIGIESEIHFYEKQFGIDSQGLLEGTKASNLRISFCEKKTEEISTHGKAILKKANKRLKHFTNKLPIIGNIKKGLTTSRTLTDALEKMAHAAQDIHSTFSEGLATANVDTAMLTKSTESELQITSISLFSSETSQFYC